MNKTIVIADDNAALCSGMRDFINSQDGFEVVGVAQNGNDALRLIDLYKPDFVLLDIVMPELDGFGVLSAMENKSSIVIMMSQLASDGFVQKAMQYGASYFLAKPFDYNTALKVINDFSNPRPAQRSQVNVRKIKHWTNVSRICLYRSEFPPTSKVISKISNVRIKSRTCHSPRNRSCMEQR